MIDPPRPPNEQVRLAALRNYDILDTDPEAAFDDLTRVASAICKTPIALVSLVDDQRQWFKARVGLAATQTPRQMAFCAHAILEPTRTLVVPDSSQDERFADNPLAVGEPYVRFYAGSPLLTPDGLPLGTLCVIDHKPRALDEEQLASLQALGRQVVAQLELRRRAMDLQKMTDQLRDAYAQILQRNEEIGNFYHTLAHELKTPLTAAREFVAIVLDGIAGPVNAEQKEFLSTAKQCCDQIRVNVNDLLDMTRLETGKLSLERGPVSLQKAVTLAMAEVEGSAREKGLDLQCEILPDLPTIVGDQGRIVQVLTNLLGNAVKFTPAGGRIDVAIRPMPADGLIRISVSDTGIGIPAYNLPRVFDRLYQVRDDDASIMGGLGIGLSLCREIVRSHGGAITVASEPGRGSTFAFTLPMALAEGHEHTMTASREGMACA